MQRSAGGSGGGSDTNKGASWPERERERVEYVRESDRKE